MGCAEEVAAIGYCGWLCLSSSARARRCCRFLLAAGLSLSVKAPHASHFTHVQS